jgi:thiol:disulfide interchange protein DsbC
MLKWVMCLWLALFAGQVVADDVVDASADVKQKLVAQVPELKDATITPTDVAGIYSVQQGAFVFYTSSDAKYVFRGQLLSLADKRNVTEEAIMAFREAEFNKLEDKDTMVYMPKGGKYSHTITVFTDVDCPYCHKLHALLPEILAAGIRVRYVFFPRAGLDTPSFNKAVHAWCNQQQPGVLEAMMKGEAPAKLMTCPNPIAKHLALATSLGLQGTPSILLSNGTLIPGFVQAKDLIDMVNSIK